MAGCFSRTESPHHSEPSCAPVHEVKRWACPKPSTVPAVSSVALDRPAPVEAAGALAARWAPERAGASRTPEPVPMWAISYSAQPKAYCGRSRRRGAAAGCQGEETLGFTTSLRCLHAGRSDDPQGSAPCPLPKGADWSGPPCPWSHSLQSLHCGCCRWLLPSPREPPVQGSGACRRQAPSRSGHLPLGCWAAGWSPQCRQRCGRVRNRQPVGRSCPK